MNNKPIFLIFNSTIIFALNSCSNIKLNISISNEYTELKIVYKNDIAELINAKDDFVLFVSISTCMVCARAKKIINEYINTYHYLIFNTDYSEIETNKYFQKIKSIPSLIFIDNGEILTIKSHNLDDEQYVLSMLKKYIV